MTANLFWLKLFCNRRRRKNKRQFQVGICLNYFFNTWPNWSEQTSFFHFNKSQFCSKKFAQLFSWSFELPAWPWVGQALRSTTLQGHLIAGQSSCASRPWTWRWNCPNWTCTKSMSTRNHGLSRYANIFLIPFSSIYRGDLCFECCSLA